MSSTSPPKGESDAVAGLPERPLFKDEVHELMVPDGFALPVARDNSASEGVFTGQVCPALCVITRGELVALLFTGGTWGSRRIAWEDPGSALSTAREIRDALDEKAPDHFAIEPDVEVTSPDTDEFAERMGRDWTDVEMLRGGGPGR